MEKLGGDMIVVVWRAGSGPRQCSRFLDEDKAADFVRLAASMGATVVEVMAA